jgi:GxxExxY protein
MTENEIARVVVDCAYQIHTKLGPGLLESVYEVVLASMLHKRGLKAERQVPIPIRFEELIFDEGFRADLIIEDKVIVELKSVETTAPVHRKQVLTYIRLADKRLGLLINFGEVLIKDGITRLVNGLQE